MKIELRRTKGRTGDRSIVVDGVVWGVSHMEPHGVHGPLYYFVQMGAAGAIHEDYTRSNGDASRRRVTIKGLSKHDGYKREPDLRSTDQRILDKAEQMIEAGLLKHPDAVAKEKIEQAARWKAVREATERERRDADLEIARKLIENYGAGDDFAERIADAIQRERAR